MDEGQSGRLGEAGIDVDSGLGRCFIVRNSSSNTGSGHGTQPTPSAIGRSDAELFRSGSGDAPFLFLVNFVAQNHKGEVRRSISAEATTNIAEELILPALQMVQAARVRHIVHEQTRIGSTVEGGAQTLEAFLAGRIPYLQCAGLGQAGGWVGHCQVLGEKVGADGGLILAGEGAGMVPVHEGGLPNAGIAQQNDFEEGLLLLSPLVAV
mmetsp:Transcript_5552/g.15637  ORF Transcript_5552/g.15637 Transcript_5552/m.15637 type:complete len:209 (+) Transcript_5552:369-995(+)